MNWKTVKLGEIGKVVTGKTPRTSIAENYGGNIPFLTPSDDMAQKFAPVTNKTLTEQGLREVKNCLIPANSLCVSCIGSDLGKVVMNREPLVTNQQINSIIPHEDVDAHFVYYAMIEIGKHLNHLSKTSTAVPIINKSTFSNTELAIPSLETQRRIAAILSSLDDKIENNNRINRNLEAQAQALFKSWFVDFEPWGGKMPEDWKEYHLTEFAEIISGYSYKGAELMPSKDAMATIKNFDRKGYFKLDGYKEIQISGRFKNSQILNLFDVIVAHTDITQQADIIGNPAIILSKGGYRNIIMSMDLCKVQPTHYAISSAFLYCLLKDNRFKSHALGYVNGTTVLHMSKKALPEYRVFLPNDLSKVQELGDQLQNLYKRYSINLGESARLAVLRDTLLPKLMKGEIEV